MSGRRIQLIWPHDPTMHAPAKYKRACRYEAFVPDRLMGLPLELEATVVGVVSEAERAIHELNAGSGVALAPLARLLLRTESIASSKVEGMVSDVRDLARAEARAESGRMPSGTVLEILANIEAMELAVREAAHAAPFGKADILAVHRRLMERSPNPRIAGRFRIGQNWIGGNDYNPCGADFVPPPPDEVPGLLADLCDAMNADVLPPIVQAALVHAQFETIHPFDDGNGRTGRALIHAVLRRRGLTPNYVPPISVVLAQAKGRYIDGLSRFRDDRVSDWIEHFAAAAMRAAELAKAYVRAVEDLVLDWKARLEATGAPRAGATAWDVIDILPAHPVISAAAAAAATQRSKAAIYEALDQLRKAGVLKPLSASQRNQSWEAVGLLDLLAGLEAGTLPRARGR